MSNYLVLYQSEAALTGMSVSEMFKNTTPEQMAAGMAAWQSWHTKTGSAVLDLGAPLDNSTTVVAGTETHSKSAITGYTMLEAASMEDAVKIMQDHPHFHMPGASIQILECIAMPGMYAGPRTIATHLSFSQYRFANIQLRHVQPTKATRTTPAPPTATHA